MWWEVLLGWTSYERKEQRSFYDPYEWNGESKKSTNLFLTLRPISKKALKNRVLIVLYVLKNIYDLMDDSIKVIEKYCSPKFSYCKIFFFFQNIPI